ncbi:hypothetical protein [Nguyenibacter vanlangensis]|uniref:hypothetical protein n=1 Tax=Nguyenibacter vanlangensis TaxID=1216886 RepID=UPI0038D1FC75
MSRTSGHSMVGAIFPGLAYQCGNLIAAGNALLQTEIAILLGTGLASALMLTVGGVSSW